MSIDFDMNKALEQLGQIVQQQGPKTVEIASRVVQINAIDDLICGVAWVILSMLPLWTACWCWRQTLSPPNHYDPKSSWSWEPPWQWYAAVTIAFLAFVIMIIRGVGALTDIWAWVALFQPKLALAHEVYQKIKG